MTRSPANKGKIMFKLFTLAAAAAIAGLTSAGHAADPAAGAVLFRQKCMMCHQITPGTKGMMAPNLSNLAGRPAASTDFAYSPALKKAGLVWTAGTLGNFLTAPNRLVPGTRMIVSVPDDAKRADMVAYLMTLDRK
jgi:cytochrome c